MERVVLVMRHGVRPPTKAPAMPAGTAAEPWPAWPVAPGELTPHGAAAVRLLGRADRTWLGVAMPGGGACPAPTAVRMLSDSDQRTIATGDAYLDGLAPGCRIANGHRPQGEPDPLFAAAGETGPLDPARADAAVRDAAGPGGIAAADRLNRKLLARLDRILCGQATAACGISAEATRIVPATAGKRPKLAGALDRGSTAAQILLLEYADGKPLAEVGWGRATLADVTALSALHAFEFELLARPPYLAARNVAPIARALLAGLEAESPASLTVVVGHDTNIASLGGLLGLHWQAPGYARDDPPPGGALVFQLLRDAGGGRYVRARFRAQSLDQLRALRPGADYRATLAIPGCGAPCPLDRFRSLVEAKLAAAEPAS